MTSFADKSKVAWLLDQDLEWYDLTARGPFCFDRYARLRFIPDPAFLGQRDNDADIADLGGPGPCETWQIGVAVAHLAHHTTTPEECYYLIWEGGPDVETLCTRLGAAIVDLYDPEWGRVRGYYLFRGDTDRTPDNEDAGVRGPIDSSLSIPAFI